MQTGAITGYIDVAQLTLYAFWAFFAGLVLWLRREDKREGYPLASDRADRVRVVGFPGMPDSKTFIRGHGEPPVTVPREAEVVRQMAMRPAAGFPGAPNVPVGDPMLASIGPGAYALRADAPDLGFDDGKPKIVPLRSASDFFLAWEDPDPRGWPVHGADGALAGTVVDGWVDRSEVVIRYLEVELAEPATTPRVLLPMNFLTLRRRQRRVVVKALLGRQFAAIPALRNPDIVTLLEEDKILAYFGGGLMYATPSRAEPLL